MAGSETGNTATHGQWATYPRAPTVIAASGPVTACQSGTAPAGPIGNFVCPGNGSQIKGLCAETIKGKHQKESKD
jgi:hypothetical protein